MTSQLVLFAVQKERSMRNLAQALRTTLFFGLELGLGAIIGLLASHATTWSALLATAMIMALGAWYLLWQLAFRGTIYFGRFLNAFVRPTLVRGPRPGYLRQRATAYALNLSLGVGLGMLGPCYWPIYILAALTLTWKVRLDLQADVSNVSL